MWIHARERLTSFLMDADQEDEDPDQEDEEPEQPGRVLEPRGPYGQKMAPPSFSEMLLGYDIQSELYLDTIRDPAAGNIDADFEISTSPISKALMERGVEPRDAANMKCLRLQVPWQRETRAQNHG